MGKLSDVPDMQRVMEKSIRNSARKHYSDEQIDALTQSYKEQYNDFILNTQFEVVIAEHRDRISGFGAIDYQYSSINSLFVHPEFMGQGIGESILKKLENMAKEWFCDGLMVFASINAAGFYEKYGYTEIRNVDIETPDGRFVPSVLMSKEFEGCKFTLPIPDGMVEFRSDF